MKKHACFSFLLFAFFLTARLTSFATDFGLQQPIILLNDSDVVLIHHWVNSDKAAKKIFKPIKKSAKKSLKGLPNPAGEIHIDGFLKNDPKRLESMEKLQGMDDLLTLSYAFIGTEDEKYAQKARGIILAWVEAYQPTGNPINEDWLTPIFVSYQVVADVFSKEEKMKTEGWIRKIAEKEMELGMKEPEEQGNSKSKRLKIVGLAGTMFNDLNLLEYAVTGVKKYIDRNLFGDGASYDLHMHDAMTYHTESLESLLSLIVVMPANENMYTYQNKEGGSVKKSVEFVVPFAQGREVFKQWQNSKIDFDKERWENGDADFQPGINWNPKSALDLFVYASFFDSNFGALVSKLSAGTNTTYPEFESLLIKAKRQSSGR